MQPEKIRHVTAAAVFVDHIRTLAKHFHRDYAAFRNAASIATAEAQKNAKGNDLLAGMIEAVKHPDVGGNPALIADRLAADLAEAAKGMQRYEVTVQATGVLFVYAASPGEAEGFTGEYVTMDMVNRLGSWTDNSPTVTDVMEAE